MLTHVDGIVIKTQNYGESHKIITIFSKEMGKFTAICRGANKAKSRLQAIAQPFIKATFLVYVTKGLSTVQQGETLDSYRSIREDIIKTAYAAYIAELTDKLMEPKQKAAFLYKQLSLTFDWIHQHDDYTIPIIMYELKMFQIGGFAPVVDYCVHCGRKETPYTFSIQEGGLLCPHCTSLDEYAVHLPSALPHILAICKEVGIEQIGNISVKEENKQLLRHILDNYYEQYGGFTLKSKRFLNQIDRLS